MSVIAAAAEDLEAGKHTRLSDLHFLSTLSDDLVPAA